MIADPIHNALIDISHQIPREILIMTFMNSADLVGTLENRIRERVIVDRVMKDINLYSGQLKDIALKLEYLEHTTPDHFDVSYLTTAKYGLYRIPPEARENLDINSVTSLRFPYNLGLFPTGYLGPNAGATMESITNSVINSHTYANVPTLPIPVLLKGNLIKLEPKQYTHHNWILNCRLDYDKSLTNLNHGAYKPLSDLIVTATQACIYNSLVFTKSQGVLVAGSELSIVQTFLDKYSESNEQYQEKLDLFRGSSMLSNERIRSTFKYIF